MVIFECWCWDYLFGRERGVSFHICEHCGVALQKLIESGSSGTFYFQEGHMISLSSAKRLPFCSITLERKDKPTDIPRHRYTVFEKRADFRLLPNFTGIRFRYEKYFPGDVVREISCYTPVIEPKKTEYDSLRKEDLAYAFHINLEF